MEEMHHLARDRIGMPSERMKTRYDARATGHDFHKGDKVRFWNPKRRKGFPPNLQTNWEGPYTVLKKLNDVVVRIQKSPHSKNRRKYQTAFSRFVSGHIKAFTFCQGQKIFPEYHLCYSELVSPAHILTCLDFKKDEVLLDPLLFIEFLDFFGFMRLSSIARESGAIASRRLDFYLLVHGRYFISLLPPIGNQWRRSPIRHLGTRPLGVTGSPEGKKVDLPTYLGVTLDPELRFSKHIEQTANKALGKLNILRKLSGTSWGSRPQTLKITFCTAIRPVLEYATPIWTPASISVKRKLDSVQHRAAKIIIGAVSSTNNEKAEQECGLPPIESRRNLTTIKFTNKLRSYDLDHISRRVFDKWKHSTRLKRSSTLQLDSELRKLNLEHSSLEFLQEPLIPKNPPKNTCFELELLRPCSKKEDPATLRQKGLETIEILSQDNFAIANTDGSSDRSLSNGGAGILLLLPDGNNYKHKINTGIIASNFTSELMTIREALILYQQDPHVIDSTEGLVIFSDSLNQL
ncbi:RNase H domain-containing protein [Trichonephila clavipes]|nr:RNase H domain-containing protein [Trichonephila clavipes]